MNWQAMTRLSIFLNSTEMFFTHVFIALFDLTMFSIKDFGIENTASSLVHYVFGLIHIF